MKLETTELEQIQSARDKFNQAKIMLGDIELNKQVVLSEIDVIKDQRSEDPVVEAQKRDLKKLLTKGLTRAERLIIVLYYYEEMTMKEIGATLDLSESRVSQMHSSIVDRLKAQMHTRKKEFAVK